MESSLLITDNAGMNKEMLHREQYTRDWRSEETDIVQKAIWMNNNLSCNNNNDNEYLE